MKFYIFLLVGFIWAGTSAALTDILSPGTFGDIRRADNAFGQDLMQAVADRLLPAPPDCAMLLRADALFAQGQYERACALYADYASGNPASPFLAHALAGIADCHMLQGNYRTAAEDYASVPVSGLTPTQKGKLNFRRGLCLLCLEQPDAAGRFFTEATQYASTRPAAEYYLGVIAFDARRWDDAERHFSRTDSRHAPGDRAPYYLAQIDFARGSWTKAVASSRSVLRTAQPDMQPAMLRIAGESLCRLGQDSEGMEYLRRYLAVADTPQPSALYMVGVDDYGRREYGNAVDLLGRAVALSDDSRLLQSAYLFIGQALIHLGDNDAALMAFDKALKIDSGDPAVKEAAFYNYAVTRLQGARMPFSSSADILEQFLEQYPSGTYSGRVAAYLTEGYLALGDYAAALDRSRRIADPSPHMLALRQKALYGLGQTAMQQKDYNSAAQYLAEAANISADKDMEAETALLQGMVEQARGNDAAAVKYFERYVNRRPANSPNVALGNYRLGYALYNMGSYGEAEKVFRRALPMTEDAVRADILSRTGDVRLAAADYDSAADCYRQAIATWTPTADYPALQMARSYGYRRDYKAKLTALDDFTKNYPQSPLMPDAMLEMTQAQISLGDNDAAVATYRRLISAFPGTEQSRRAYLEMAMTLYDQGNVADAADAYRSLITLCPTSAEAANAATLLRYLYAGQGHADEYMSFMRSVDNAPAIDAADQESLAYESAVNALRMHGDASQLQRFIRDFTLSAHRPEALALLMSHAMDSDDRHAGESYAGEILENYPDSRGAEAAMAVVAQSRHNGGDTEGAMAMWRQLADRTGDPGVAMHATAGMLRAAREMADAETAVAMADRLLDTGAAAADGISVAEIKYTKADALDAKGDTKAAVALWLEAAPLAADEFGARSAYRAADALADAGQASRALDVARQFTRSGSPHHYWLARTFILMSDIYRSQGKMYEAREYLLALRENYPGNDTDISAMIDERLTETSDK